MKNRQNSEIGYINIETGNGIKTKGHELYYSEICSDNETDRGTALNITHGLKTFFQS